MCLEWVCVECGDGGNVRSPVTNEVIVEINDVSYSPLLAVIREECLTLCDGRTQFAPTGPVALSRIIKQFKGMTSKRCGQSLWQKSFYDHIIRDENDFLTRWNYIDTNPARWQEDQYCEG